MGIEPPFKFKIYEDMDEVYITGYNSNKDNDRLVEIPSFVKDISTNFLFHGVNQNISLLYKGNKIKSFENLFNGYDGEKLVLNIYNKNIECMASMFIYCKKLKKIEFINFNTENVTNMHHMFHGCKSLVEIDLSKFNTCKVSYMDSMFSDCKSLNKLKLNKKVIYQLNEINDILPNCDKLEI